MPNSKHIFVSYRHKEPDYSLAHEMADALHQAGHEVFIDTGMRWGADWVKNIRDSLEKTDYLLLLLSEQAIASEMIVEEVSIASELAHQHNGQPVILPLRISLQYDQPLPYHLSAILRSIQQQFWDGPQDTPKIIKRLLDLISDQTEWAEQLQPKVEWGREQHAGPDPFFDPRNFIIPGGALDESSEFYVVREADVQALRGVRRDRGIVTVRGARQTGKTSLITRLYNSVQDYQAGLRCSFTDFQVIGRKSFQTENEIWKAVAIDIADQLEVEEDAYEQWSEAIRHDRNFSKFLDRYVFKSDDTPLLICIDEVDRVFEFDIKSDFFGTIRGFYNRGARDKTFRSVRWLLATSSEPKFFIEDLNQSPFNVGDTVGVNAFIACEIEDLAKRHRLTLKPEVTEKIIDYLGGHPYLVHLLIYRLKTEPESRDKLFDAQSGGGGVFRDHLHRYLIHFQQNRNLAEAMIRILNQKECEDIKLVERLIAAGLVTRDENDHPMVRCRLYHEFFNKELA